MTRCLHTFLIRLGERLGLCARRVVVDCVDEVPDDIKPWRLYAVGDGL